jgi:hypothetical protein
MDDQSRVIRAAMELIWVQLFFLISNIYQFISNEPLICKRFLFPLFLSKIVLVEVPIIFKLSGFSMSISISNRFNSFNLYTYFSQSLPIASRE